MKRSVSWTALSDVANREPGRAHRSLPAALNGTYDATQLPLSLRQTSLHSKHLLTNFGWLTTIGSKKLNDSSLVLLGRIMHLERTHLTV
jgi:hypothetical protein